MIDPAKHLSFHDLNAIYHYLCQKLPAEVSVRFSKPSLSLVWASSTLPQGVVQSLVSDVLFAGMITDSLSQLVCIILDLLKDSKLLVRFGDTTTSPTRKKQSPPSLGFRMMANGARLPIVKNGLSHRHAIKLDDRQDGNSSDISRLNLSKPSLSLQFPDLFHMILIEAQLQRTRDTAGEIFPPMHYPGYSVYFGLSFSGKGFGNYRRARTKPYTFRTGPVEDFAPYLDTPLGTGARKCALNAHRTDGWAVAQLGLYPNSMGESHRGLQYGGCFEVYAAAIDCENVGVQSISVTLFMTADVALNIVQAGGAE